MVNKGSLVQDIIVLAITETWITPDDPDSVKLDTAPADYIIIHLPHPTATVRSHNTPKHIQKNLHTNLYSTKNRENEFDRCQTSSATAVTPLIRVPAVVHQDIRRHGSQR